MKCKKEANKTFASPRRRQFLFVRFLNKNNKNEINIIKETWLCCGGGGRGENV